MFSTPFTFMSAPAGGFDPNAETFFTAAGITDLTQKDAVNQLVLDLKADSLWSLMKVIYPLVGTTSSQQSYNLVDPTTYQMDWLGGWSFSSNGALGNGSNTQANTTIDFSTLGVGLNSFALGTYNRLSVGENEGVDAGVAGVGTDSGNVRRINFYSSYAGDVFFDPGNEDQRMRFATPGTTGFWAATRTSSSVYGIYRNGSSLSNTTSGSQSATALPTNPLTFGDINSSNPPSPTAPSSQQYALMFVSDGLTSGQISTLNTIVQTYQTTLSRQV